MLKLQGQGKVLAVHQMAQADWNSRLVLLLETLTASHVRPGQSASLWCLCDVWRSVMWFMFDALWRDLCMTLGSMVCL